MAWVLLNQLTGESKLASSTYVEPLKSLKALVYKVEVSYNCEPTVHKEQKHLQRKSVWLQSLGKSCWRVDESFALFTIYWVRYEKKFWTAYLNRDYYFIYPEVASKVTKRYARIFDLEKDSTSLHMVLALSSSWCLLFNTCFDCSSYNGYQASLSWLRIFKSAAPNVFLDWESITERITTILKLELSNTEWKNSKFKE